MLNEWVRPTDKSPAVPAFFARVPLIDSIFAQCVWWILACLHTLAVYLHNCANDRQIFHAKVRAMEKWGRSSGSHWNLHPHIEWRPGDNKNSIAIVFTLVQTATLDDEFWGKTPKPHILPHNFIKTWWRVTEENPSHPNNSIFLSCPVPSSETATCDYAADE